MLLSRFLGVLRANPFEEYGGREVMFCAVLRGCSSGGWVLGSGTGQREGNRHEGKQKDPSSELLACAEENTGKADEKFKEIAKRRQFSLS